MPPAHAGRSEVERLHFEMSGALTALLVTTVVACHGRPPEVRPIESLAESDFRAYVQPLQFVRDTEAGDRQALLVGRYPDSARYGPLATILPEVNANRGAVSQLRSGRIIARIINESGESYAKLGLLPHAVTYWWVQYDERADTGRSVFITVDSAGRVIGRTVSGLEVTRYHPGGFRVNQPLARFVWTDNDEEVWGSCNGVCCKQVPR